jgi:hypothetical protein
LARKSFEAGFLEDSPYCDLKRAADFAELNAELSLHAGAREIGREFESFKDENAAVKG